ncbi:ATP-binding protein [Candidatus Bipolaricaulota bacterium]|nr:ATP-binding protein [Candidatus Bipolaricaulota bacterium]
MRNPFVYGKVARGECFADRAREVEELSADILAGQNVILFSPRRYGKTSLILEVLDRLRTQGVLTVYLDLFRITSEEEFVAAYAREIARLCGGGMKAVLKKVRELLPRLIPRVSLKGEGFEVEFTFDLRVEREPLLADLFEAVATIARERGRPAAVVFDEFQEIARWDKGEKIQRTMRAHFQHHPEVSYVFMGSKRHLMHELFQNKNRPFYRFGKHFPLGKIPKEEFAAFIRARFEATGFDVQQGVPERILELTENHPYYTQVLCHVLWDLFRDEGRLEAGHVELGVEEVIAREAHAFHELWDALPLKARQLLVALAKEGTPRVEIYSRAFLEKHNLGPPSSVQRAVERLLEDEVLERVNGEYEFTDVFFKRWLQRESP